MRFLIDNALSRRVAAGLTEAGHDAVHVRDYYLQASPDEEILARAQREDRILVSADSDFGALLALTRTKKPSVILVREALIARPEECVSLLVANLPNLASNLERGCIVVFRGGRIRLRCLPISPEREEFD